jgi:hypothetical protein
MPIGKIGLEEEYSGTIKSGVFTVKDQFSLTTADRWPTGTVNNLIKSFTFSEQFGFGLFSSNVQTLPTNDGYKYGIWSDTIYAGGREVYLDFQMGKSAVCTVDVPSGDISGNGPRFKVGAPGWGNQTDTTGWSYTGLYSRIRLTPGKNTVVIYIPDRNPSTLYSSSNPIYVNVRDI